MEVILGKMQFGQTTKSISGKSTGAVLDRINLFVIEKWELPVLFINPKTNCFEPTGKTYYKYGITQPTNGGSHTYYFNTLADAQIFAEVEFAKE